MQVYIIGGIVDRNRLKGVTYKKAQEQGIATAKLPLDKYVEMGASTRVLTVNHGALSVLGPHAASRAELTRVWCLLRSIRDLGAGVRVERLGSSHAFDAAFSQRRADQARLDNKTGVPSPPVHKTQNAICTKRLPEYAVRHRSIRTQASVWLPLAHRMQRKAISRRCIARSMSLICSIVSESEKDARLLQQDKTQQTNSHLQCCDRKLGGFDGVVYFVLGHRSSTRASWGSLRHRVRRSSKRSRGRSCRRGGRRGDRTRRNRCWKRLRWGRRSSWG